MSEIAEPKMKLVLHASVSKFFIEKDFPSRDNPFVFALPKHKGSYCTDTLIVPNFPVVNFPINENWRIDFKVDVEHSFIDISGGNIIVVAEFMSVEIKGVDLGEEVVLSLEDIDNPLVKKFLREILNPKDKTDWKNPEGDLTFLFDEEKV